MFISLLWPCKVLWGQTFNKMVSDSLYDKLSLNPLIDLLIYNYNRSEYQCKSLLLLLTKLGNASYSTHLCRYEYDSKQDSYHCWWLALI